MRTVVDCVWTLLYKKKRNLIDGSEHILYDRLKKDVK